ncbi:MAG: MarR family transcriptional regulator [Clostridia bacterium]|nr:MarR family transcriptional regulator [Clostridia bacterium]
MDSGLKEELVRSTRRIKKMGMLFTAEGDIHMGEFAVMRAIAGCPNRPIRSVYVSEIQNNVHITKPAVSQILNSLEKKGYVSREMDREDRRKIAVSITPAGQEILIRFRDNFDRMLEAITSRLGEDNTKELVRLLNRLADIAQDLTREGIITSDNKGEDKRD